MTHSHILGHFVDIIHKDDADIALLKVECDALDAIFEFHQLVSADIVEAIYVSHTVANFKDGAYLFESHFLVDALKLLF